MINLQKNEDTVDSDLLSFFSDKIIKSILFLISKSDGN